MLLFRCEKKEIFAIYTNTTMAHTHLLVALDVFAFIGKHLFFDQKLNDNPYSKINQEINFCFCFNNNFYCQ